MPNTAAHYRERNVAVIFPVNSERETGYRRYNNEVVPEICAENSDMIPFASVDPHKGKMGAKSNRFIFRRQRNHRSRPENGTCSSSSRRSIRTACLAARSTTADVRPVKA